MATWNRITPEEMVGKKFGRLEILRFYGRRKSQNVVWWCKCECGVEKPVDHSPLTRGLVVSCGCYNRDNKKTLGGLQKRYPKEYKCWHAMIQRCNNSEYHNYRLYGGRGIAVCKEWVGESGFKRFIEYIGECPNSNLSLDRIDNDGDYKEGNVRWTDTITQNNNRRNNHPLSLNGRTQNVKAWCVELGINEQTLHERLKRGWSVKKTLTTPVKRRKT